MSRLFVAHAVLALLCAFAAGLRGYWVLPRYWQQMAGWALIAVLDGVQAYFNLWAVQPFLYAFGAAISLGLVMASTGRAWSWWWRWAIGLGAGALVAGAAINALMWLDGKGQRLSAGVAFGAVQAFALGACLYLAKRARPGRADWWVAIPVIGSLGANAASSVIWGLGGSMAGAVWGDLIAMGVVLLRYAARA